MNAGGTSLRLVDPQWFQSWRSRTKIAESIGQRQGSADPEPYQNARSPNTRNRIVLFNKPASKSKRMREPRLCPIKETSPEKPGFLNATKPCPVKNCGWKCQCSGPVGPDSAFHCNAEPDPTLFTLMRIRIQLMTLMRTPDEDSDPASRNPWRSEFTVP